MTLPCLFGRDFCMGTSPQACGEVEVYVDVLKHTCNDVTSVWSSLKASAWLHFDRVKSHVANVFLACNNSNAFPACCWPVKVGHEKPWYVCRACEKKVMV